MTNALFTIIIMALLGMLAWREREHAKQLKDIFLLKKSDRPEEYAHYREIDTPAKEEPVTQMEVDLEDTTPEEWANLNNK